MTEDSGATERAQLSVGRLLARNTVINVAGQLIVLLLAFLAVPLLIDRLGTARFGVLALAWVLIGYVGLLDLGLGRALTALASNRLGTGRPLEVRPLFWTATGLMVAGGMVSGIVLAGISPWLVGSVLNVPERFEHETLVSFYLLSLSLPVVIGSLGLKGILEAHQRFDLVNAIQVPMSALAYIGPVLVLQFTSGLPAVVAMVVLTRFLGFGLNLVFALRAVPTLRGEARMKMWAVRELLGFGGWVTVSNIVAPIMQHLDRLFVGALVSVSAVTYYATPYEVVRRMWIVSFSVASVLFPAFALTRVNEPQRTARLFGVGNRAIFFVMFPVALIVVTLSQEVLSLWLGADFAAKSEVVMQLLAVGVFANALAQVPFGLIQSGRPDLTVAVSVAELPIFLGAFVALTNAFGIEGAAIAWTGRQIVDAVALHALAGWLHPPVRSTSIMIGLGGIMALAAFAIAFQLGEITVKFGFLAAALTVFSIAAWTKLLAADERAALQGRVRMGVARGAERV